MCGIRSGDIRLRVGWTAGERHCKLLGMTTTNHVSTLADARVLVVDTGQIGLATARQALAADADVPLSGHSSHRLVTAPPGVWTEAASTVAGGTLARLWLSHHLFQAAADLIRDNASVGLLSDSSNGIGMHPSDRQLIAHHGQANDVVATILGRPA